MNYLIKLCAALIVASAICESRAADAPPDQTTLAKKLIIPRILMGDATAIEALEFTKRKSQELDPAKKGVNLVFTNLPETALPPPPKGAAADVTIPVPTEGAAPITVNPKTNLTPRVNFDLTNVSVFDVVHRIAKDAALEVTVRKDAIIVHAKGTKP